MENASKALLMAAEVLISIIILSALVLMFDSLTSYQQTEEKNEEQAAVMEFNNVYEAYNRDDVRGNDLYSLINRVVDYNRRRSTEGTGESDEGQYLAYEPITLTVSFQKVSIQEITDKFTYDGTRRLLELDNRKFTVNKINNGIYNKISNLENGYITEPKNLLLNLSTEIEKIFPEENTLEKIKQAVEDFNKIYGQEKYPTTTNSMISNSFNAIKNTYRDDVYTYYEYLQFTKAHFKCTSVGRNEGTGRIVKMEFEFTGEIN